MSPAGTPAAIVAPGGSLTDGAHGTSNANRRWTDYLARRLRMEGLPGSQPVAVVNRGIGGNLLLTDYPTAQLAGHDALERFDGDVPATAGARWLVVDIGINDIDYRPAARPVAAETLEAGWLQLIARARMHGLPATGATLAPFGGQACHTPAREAVRQRANAWIRGAGAWMPWRISTPCRATRPSHAHAARLRQRRPPASERSRLPGDGAGAVAGVVRRMTLRRLAPIVERRSTIYPRKYFG